MGVGQVLRRAFDSALSGRTVRGGFPESALRGVSRDDSDVVSESFVRGILMLQNIDY